MAEQEETLVTPQMLERKGVWGAERVSFPIALSDIRKWAIAVYWPERPPRLYWDEEYARTTRWGGIIAPEDFNPFAWPLEAEQSMGGVQRAAGRAGGKGRRGMNGGQTDTFFRPMRPGDVIRSRTRLRNWNESTTRLGLTLFTYTETEWLNQNDELVKRHIQIGIMY